MSLTGSELCPPGVPDLEPEVHVDLLARLDVPGEDLAVAHHRVAAVAVDHVGRVDQRAPVGQQPLDAVVVAAFLVGGEGQDDVAVERHLLALEADHGLREDRRHVLDVARAPPVEVAVLLGQRERVERPVLAPRLDHVQVGQQQDRLPGAAAAEPGHQVLARRVRARRSPRPWREIRPRAAGAPRPARPAWSRRGRASC